MASHINPVSFNGNLKCYQIVTKKLSAEEKRAFGKTVKYIDQKISPEDFAKTFNLDLNELTHYVKTIPSDIRIEAKALKNKISMTLLRPESESHLPNHFSSICDTNQKELEKLIENLKKTAIKFKVDDGKPKQLNLLF